MAIVLATVSRNRSTDAVVDGVDAGGGAGKLKLRAGATLCVTIAFNANAFGNSANGTATGNGFPKTAAASASGVLTHFDVTDSTDQVLWTGTVGMAGSGADCIVDNTNVAQNQQVTINSISHSTPATVS